MYLKHNSCILKDCISCIAAVIKSSVKAGPEGERPPTREEEEEGEKMQANPAYLPIEMTFKLQGDQYMNVQLAPPDTTDVEERTKLQANPAYLPVEMMSYKPQ